MFRINRSALVQQVLAALENRSVLLFGSPGIGKSWLLTAVARKLQSGNRILVLAAENYPANSIDELQKMLGFKNDLMSVLSGLGEHSYLIIDGLDALRSEQSQRVFRRLIKTVGEKVPTCRVLASIRTFDLQQSD
jgi:DNA replication protein DnaC